MGHYRGTERGTRNFKIGKRTRKMWDHLKPGWLKEPTAVQRKVYKKLRTRKRRHFKGDEFPSL